MRITNADFGTEARGSVQFELQQPKEIRIRLDWRKYYGHTCEVALDRIDLL